MNQRENPKSAKQTSQKNKLFTPKSIFDTGFIVLTAFIAIAYAKGSMYASVDDSYITFRYAQNLIDGNGLVFNPGERFYGSTAMGFAVLAGIITLIVQKIQTVLQVSPLISLPKIAVLISAGSLWLIWFIWYRILTQHRFSLARWAGGLSIAFFLFVGPYAFTVPGHETYTYFACLVLASYLFFYKHSYALAGIVLGLAFMFRPDALLFAVLIFFIGALDHFVIQRKGFSALGEKIAAPIVFLAIVLVWEIFLRLYFGSWIPETLLAKRAQFMLGHWQVFTVEAIVRVLTARSFPYFFWVLNFVAGIFVSILLFTGAGNLKSESETKPLVLLTFLWLAHGIGLAAAYASFQVSLWFWYEIPIYYSLASVIFTGLILLAIQIKARFARERTYRFLITGIALTALLVMARDAYPTLLSRWREPFVWLHTYSYDPVVEYLREVEPNGTSIATPEPGALGYKLGEKYQVIDYLGLISPGVAEAIISSDWEFYFNRWRPEYILVVYEAEYAPVGRDWFEQNYRFIGEFNHIWWDEQLGRGIYLYQLIDEG